MEIDLELTEKSAKNTQRLWKLTATIPPVYSISVYRRIVIIELRFFLEL